MKDDMKDIVSAFLDTAESFSGMQANQAYLVGLSLGTGIVKDHLESHAAKDVAVWVTEFAREITRQHTAEEDK